MTAIGLTIGLARLLATLPYNIGAWDPFTIGSVAGRAGPRKSIPWLRCDTNKHR